MTPAGPMEVVSGAMGKERIHFEAPAAKKLDPEMGAFLDWFNGNTEGDWVVKAGNGASMVRHHPPLRRRQRSDRASYRRYGARTIRTKFATVLQHVGPDPARACRLL